jgi:hypothetical protein
MLLLAPASARADIYQQSFDASIQQLGVATYFGWRVAAGDLNGDGAGDLLVADVQAPGGGAIHVYYGAPGALPSGGPADADAIVTGVGNSVAVVDVNDDGYDDLVGGGVGAYVFHGGPAGISSGTTAAADSSMTAGAPYDVTELANVGDVNGDGIEDLAVGAYAAYDQVVPSYVYVMHGRAGGLPSGSLSLLADTVITSPYAAGRIGHSIAGGGDLDRDGYGDLAIGVYDAAGVAPFTVQTRVFHGGAAGIPDQTTASAATVLEGSQQDCLSNLGNWYFGRSIALADADADGDADLFLGSPYHPGCGGGVGALHGFEGRAGGIPSGDESGARNVITGSFAGSVFGDRVENVGDVNGDGVDDLAVVATDDYGPHFASGGAAYIVLGGGVRGPASGTVSGVLARLVAPVEYAAAGRVGAGGAAGADFDADGHADVAIGAPYYWNAPGGLSRGAVFLARGGPIPACDDTVDNDADGGADFPLDTECTSSASNAEISQCSDGVDNDGDLLVDFPADPQCKTRWRDRETAGCGLGAEMTGLATLLAAIRRITARSRRSRPRPASGSGATSTAPA